MNSNKRKRSPTSNNEHMNIELQGIQTLRELIPPKHKKTSPSSRRTSSAAAVVTVSHPCLPSTCNEELDWTAVIARAGSHSHEAAESYFRQSSSSSNDDVDDTLTFKPLHAMLKYNPPLSAVEAVLRAHPHAALDDTFEGTALKIAVESEVESMPALRLLLIAELAMSKKLCSTVTEKDEAASSTTIPTPSSIADPYIGHNPIRWISEPHISRKTAGLLLKWYPNGAFRRPTSQHDQGEDSNAANTTLLYSDSPLIEIIDDFASDQDVVSEDQEDDDDVANDESEESDNDGEYSSILPRSRRTSAKREYLRKERRWEKFLHILYATDKVLSSMRLSSTEKGSAVSSSADSTPIATFHPVHAWIRCLTNPNLGLESCRPYGVWSILRAMGQRIPSEFTAKDRSDGDRTVFQTLAESPSSHCRLCTEEIRDIVECLLDADYRSAHLPRKSDGRLVIHVALENGWPCRDIFSRKLSATCA